MMRFLRMGSRVLERTSPWGLVATGAVLALTFPVVRRGIRCAAVATTRGVLGIVDYAGEIAAHMREQADDIVAEARFGDDCKPKEDWEQAFKKARTYPRDLAVSAASAGLAVSEHVGQHAKKVKEQLQGIVGEAKNRREAKITSPVNNIEPTNEASAPEEDKDPS